jgi:hypothetical protein
MNLVGGTFISEPKRYRLLLLTAIGAPFKSNIDALMDNHMTSVILYLASYVLDTFPIHELRIVKSIVIALFGKSKSLYGLLL